MGMHVGLIAAKVSVARLREAFTKTWPKFEIIASATLAHWRETWAWKKSHEHFVSAADWSKDNPGKEVFVFWEDGPWAVMMDMSYVEASDEENLKVLSSQLGLIVSFVVETAGGCAFFWCFEKGSLRRRISNDGRIVTTEGEPIPEEDGIDTSKYCAVETEALWKAFGLQSVFEGEPTSHAYCAVCVIDRTDYGRLGKDDFIDPKSLEIHDAGVPSRAKPPLSKRPWWKFW